MEGRHARTLNERVTSICEPAYKQKTPVKVQWGCSLASRPFGEIGHAPWMRGQPVPAAPHIELKQQDYRMDAIGFSTMSPFIGPSAPSNSFFSRSPTLNLFKAATKSPTSASNSSPLMPIPAWALFMSRPV